MWVPVLVLLIAPAAAEAGVAAAWAVNDGEKIERDDLAHPARRGNSAWDGTTVKLFGARNEIIAFQVVVEADESGIGALRVGLKELRNGDARIAYAPPAQDPSLYAGRPIQVLPVHYLNVTETTKAEWAWAPGSPAAPKDTTGWKPVVLVPENARAGRGGLPLRVAPKQGQAVWIEVYVGRGQPAGVYHGEVVVDADGSVRKLPVELRVFDFVLPDRNALHVMVYFEPDQPELYHGRRLDAAYHRLARRHRVELVNAYDEKLVMANRGRFDGQDFTAQKGYEGPGEAVGNRIVPASFYGPGRTYEDKATAWPAADAWITFLSRSMPDAVSFVYMPDEPYPAEYPRVLALAKTIHSNPGVGRSLPVFVTKKVIPELEGEIDIWCVPPQAYDIAAAEAQRQKGRRVWIYNGGRPQAGTILIDGPATDARATPWASFKHDIDLYFYWHGVHWRHNSQKQGERNQDVWANPVTFDNRGQPNKPVEDQGWLNGDGVLLYPGEEKLHPQQDRGLDGPCSTIQLANIRRGVQDHLYLVLARRLGLDALVSEAIAAVVPRVFSEAGPTVGFAEAGDIYEAARLKLAAAIEAKSKEDAR
jgi:hypothetical protein